jgi:hypothetical protein
MARPTILEFVVPESHHHTLELLQQVFSTDRAQAQAKAREAQQAEQIARAKLSKGAERVLLETAKDKLPEGKVPEGAQIMVDFDAKTIGLQVPPAQEQPKPRLIKGKAKGKRPEGETQQ